MSNKYYLGIDTSCYTTSIALLDEHRNIIKDERIILYVDDGKKGLRQSEAFFQHVKNLPGLYKKVVEGIEISKIESVTVSNKPRNRVDSYMPVFKSGENIGTVIASSLEVPLNTVSHQENHIFSCLLDKDLDRYKKFNAIHISGGTTEILEVDRAEETLVIKALGRTLDLSFGQLIDRIGLKLGFSFPCGKAMEEFLQGSKCDLKTLNFNLTLKQSVKETDFNISGIENKLVSYYDAHNGQAHIKAFIIEKLFTYLGGLLNELIVKSSQRNHCKTYLIVGGVASNAIIRACMERSENLKEYHIAFGTPMLSSDNAIGNSYYGSLIGRRP